MSPDSGSTWDLRDLAPPINADTKENCCCMIVQGWRTGLVTLVTSTLDPLQEKFITKLTFLYLVTHTAPAH